MWFYLRSRLTGPTPLGKLVYASVTFTKTFLPSSRPFTLTKSCIDFSSLPTELPPLISPIKELTNEQEELLRKVANLFLPEFNVVLPSQPTDRTNPFRSIGLPFS